MMVNIIIVIIVIIFITFFFYTCKFMFSIIYEIRKLRRKIEEEMEDR
jgi:cell division protein FtsL